MKFKKIYIEITNCCNFNCSFCLSTQRLKKFLAVEEFDYITTEVKKHTDYIYLHVLGEPMLHPNFFGLLEIAKRKGLNINLTTNGSLIRKYADVFPHNVIRQCNISLHSLPDNIIKSEWDSYFESVFSFAKIHSDSTYFSFRLWNAGADEADEFNSVCLQKINREWGIELDNSVFSNRNTKIAPHIFLQNSARFSWPNQKKLDVERKVGKRCYGLHDHIAVLSDGTVVPCCLDGAAYMKLGNIFESSLEDILNKEESQRIKSALANGISPTDACKNCGFVMP